MFGQKVRAIFNKIRIKLVETQPAEETNRFVKCPTSKYTNYSKGEKMKMRSFLEWTPRITSIFNEYMGKYTQNNETITKN